MYRGKPHGKGKLIMMAGYSYEGNFKYGKRHGEGIMYCPDGGVIKGNWKDGAFVG